MGYIRYVYLQLAKVTRSHRKSPKAFSAAECESNLGFLKNARNLYEDNDRFLIPRSKAAYDEHQVMTHKSPVFT